MSNKSTGTGTGTVISYGLNNVIAVLLLFIQNTMTFIIYTQ